MNGETEAKTESVLLAGCWSPLGTWQLRPLLRGCLQRAPHPDLVSL